MSVYRVFRLRHRYIWTRSNKLRMRYIVGCITVASLSMTSLFGAMGTSIALAPPYADLAASGDDAPPVVRMASFAPDVMQGRSEADHDVYETGDDLSADETQGVVHLESLVVLGQGMADDDQETSGLRDPLAPREKVIEIGAGDTVAGVLQKAGVSGQDAYGAVEALSEHFDPRYVKAGQAISVRLEPKGDEMEFAAMNIKIDPVREVVVQKDEGKGAFESELKEKDVVLHTNAAHTIIETSLYGSAARAGIPASVVAQMIRIYSYEIDFQRDIRQGDKVEIMYETYKTDDGSFVRYGDVLYANLQVHGKSFPVYRFEGKDGHADFYNQKGQSVKKSLMRTPVDGARMSSGFGMRRHPVLGYNKMHKGVDFAAPIGTPIYAAGDGTVELAGRRGSYGNYVRIRHNGTIKTAYAHMHKFAKGIKPGARVKQGDVIGYVGATGRATGPHLHYEVLKSDKQVNPNSITEPTGKTLAGAELEQFKGTVASLTQQYAAMAGDMKVAQGAVEE